MATVIDVRRFGAVPGAGDCTAALVRAAAACRGLRDATLLLPPGRYAISAPRGSETWLGISNHDNGIPRRVALHLVGCEGLTISAAGAELIANGQVVPLLIEGGRDLVVDGLTIDWATPLHAWGAVVGAWNGWIDVRIVAGHPWRVVRERLCFVVDGLPEEVWGTYGVSAADLTPAERSGDNCGSAWTLPWVAEQLEDGVVRLRTHIVEPPKPGDIVILRHGQRIAPAIAADGVERIRLRDVTVRQAGGMGVIMQRCSDPTLERVRVVAGPGRPLSTNHDATHFVSCRGTVRLAGCVFERQLDDATNVHGVYLELVERLGPASAVLRFGHPQQRGTRPAVVGERFAVVERETLLERGRVTVTGVRTVNAEFTEIDVAGELPAAAVAGCLLESIDGRPDVEIRDCTVAHNRARGFLITAGGTTRIEGNRFETPGPAIRISGDDAWFESGGVAEVTIRGNRFHRCGYAREPRWGKAVVLIDPEMKRVAGAYHGRIAIEDNEFAGCLLPAVEARAVGELTVRRNAGVGAESVGHRECGNVRVE